MQPGELEVGKPGANRPYLQEGRIMNTTAWPLRCLVSILLLLAVALTCSACISLRRVTSAPKAPFSLRWITPTPTSQVRVRQPKTPTRIAAASGLPAPVQTPSGVLALAPSAEPAQAPGSHAECSAHRNPGPSIPRSRRLRLTSRRQMRSLTRRLCQHPAFLSSCWFRQQAHHPP